VTLSQAEIVRRGYERFGAGDLEGFLEYVHPEIDWNTSGLFPGMRDHYAGYEGVAEFFRTFTEVWESVTVELLQLIELDEGILVRARFFARGREGIEVDREFGQHLQLEDGRLRRIRSWGEWPDALRALGLDSPG
jgi:ketosteroid isomerase-like protein